MFGLLKAKSSGRQAVADFLLSLVETHAPAEEARGERRDDDRIAISLAVAVIPCVGGQPDLDRAFVTMTCDISRDGASLVVTRRFDDERCVIGFPGKTITYVAAEVVYREPQVMGCWRLGLRMTEVVEVPPHAGLERFLLQT